MENLTYHHKTQRKAQGSKSLSLVGVVASGNLEVLAERVLPDLDCQFEIKTSVDGFGDVWQAVIVDFVERYSPGGLRLSINDGGARPDTVALRLAQVLRSLEDVA